MGLLLILGTTACREAAAPPKTARNLVLIVIDTLRRDHLSAYGYERDTSPRLRALATEGTTFQGYATASWTKPSVASILTGLHPVRHQAVLADALPDSAHTLAEYLDERGYQTLAITSNAHISPVFGFGQGFDEFEPLMREFDTAELPVPADLSRALLERIEKLEPPYFLYLHYLDPHAPYDPETAWDGTPLPPHLRERAPMRGVDMKHQRFVERDPQFIRDAIDLYDGEIRGVDRNIEEVLRALGERGLMDSTLTVVTADHGEEFEEHGRMGHGKTLYEEGVGVPLIFHAPGIVAAGARYGTASILDILPTALDLLGFPAEPSELDGKNQAARLRTGPGHGGDTPEPRELMLFLDLREVGRLGSLALVRGTDKLVLSRFPHAKELFDLAADAGEAQSLFAQTRSRPLAADLSTALARRYMSLAQNALPRAEVSVDPSVTRAIEALGYVGEVHSGVGFDSPLPQTVRAADTDPHGLLGWEPDVPEAACVTMAETDALGRLLHGWLGVESAGRWTEPLATLALARPGGVPTALRIEGINPAPAPMRVRVALDSGTAVDSELPPGRFARRIPLSSARDESGPFLVRLERLPPLMPARVTPEGRVGLGVFVTRVCLLKD